MFLIYGRVKIPFFLSHNHFIRLMNIGFLKCILELQESGLSTYIINFVFMESNLYFTRNVFYNNGLNISSSAKQNIIGYHFENLTNGIVKYVKEITTANKIFSECNFFQRAILQIFMIYRKYIHKHASAFLFFTFIYEEN